MTKEKIIDFEDLPIMRARYMDEHGNDITKAVRAKMREAHRVIMDDASRGYPFFNKLQRIEKT